MRIDHSQLAEDSSALKREKAAAPSNGARQKRALAISSSLFGSTSPTGSREERALKDLAFFGECATSMYCSRRTTASLQRPGSWPPPLQGRVRGRRDTASKCDRWQWAVSRGGSSARQQLSRPLRISQRGSDLTKWRLESAPQRRNSPSASLRVVLEDRPDPFAVWKLDLKNAFNEFSRTLLTQRVAEAPPPIRRLLPFVCAILGPSAPLATDATPRGQTSPRWKAHSRAARSGRHCSACGLSPT
jgi:hypothetical protein